MFLIHGHYKFLPKRSAVRNVWCTVCKQPRLAIGVRSLLVIHLFWIPVLPVARVTDWVCASCGKDADAHRPMRAFISGCGLAVGWLLVAMGVLGVVVSRQKKFEANPAILILAVGVVLVSALLIQRWQARRDGFERLSATVPPLDGERCPLCDDLVLTRDNPRCESCQVDIQTR